VIYQECKSKDGWQEIPVKSSNPENAPYIVTIPSWAVEDAICSCPGFEYRGKCRHLSEASAKICSWSEIDSDFRQTEEQKRKRICPKCGNKTVTIIEGE
jgi:hypothetical protein